MRRRLWLAWLLAGCAGPLWAGQLVVRISDSDSNATEFVTSSRGAAQ